MTYAVAFENEHGSYRIKYEDEGMAILFAQVLNETGRAQKLRVVEEVHPHDEVDVDWHSYGEPAAMPTPLTPFENPIPHPLKKGRNYQHRPAFVTGSRAYGAPRDDSDLDVVCVATDELLSLAVLESETHSTNKDIKYNGLRDAQCRFGKLNLIMTDIHGYDIWRAGTLLLQAEASSVPGNAIPRKRAVEIFDALRGTETKK